VAALLHAGDDCVLSHDTAAAVWGLVGDSDPVHVTLAGRRIRAQPGLDLHRVSTLDIRDVRICRGFPVTAPARTLLDRAAVVGEDELLRTLAQARVKRLVTDADLAGALERAPTRPGAALLRRVLRQEVGAAPTRSEAERRLLRLVADAELPVPETNVRRHGFEVDFVWRAARLVLEIDGYAFHGHRGAFEANRRRDQVLVAAGYRVIRVTWRQLCEEPLAVAVRIAQALGAG
jgi:very-short-patch-repair endonuclease